MRRAKCAGKAPNARLDQLGYPVELGYGPKQTDPWFPEKGESLNPGKIICFTCPVRAECGDYRDRTGSKKGMWAGEIRK